MSEPTPPTTPTPPATPAPTGEKPPIQNWLWQSIVVTVCCCLPLGVVGIVFAAQVNGKLAAGDTAGAEDAAKKAKLFTMIGFFCGLAFDLIVALIYGAAIAAALSGAGGR